MEKFEIVKAYEDFKTRLNDLEKVLQIPILKGKIQENDQAMSSPTFWDNPTLATKFLQENNENKEKIKTY